MTVEPTHHDERHVLEASALLRLCLADGPLPERLEEAVGLLAELQRLPLLRIGKALTWHEIPKVVQDS